ncbi:T9SS type A sorting domain-containing protein [Plebeiibacterium marinum]|uniref:T9SS type A sorting domain-containing protein n=1 Tax=Plebeiibacterium marinum TaxID=2992111 RepID=A0AAE3SKP4_9BACT|nr:T9SS type A sorting domain-containing protein [Plebeiobacterium marinum]MCW3806634.1 T9SS type A sorting domain-containing protein [Plebeiobacterium marinum]
MKFTKMRGLRTNPLKKTKVPTQRRLWLSAMLIFFSMGIINAQKNENIAIYADVSTSLVSGWESLDAVNDGYEPVSSTDRSHPVYGNWYSPNTFNWIEYEWAASCIIDSVKVYWFTDNGGLLIPDTAFFEYYENGDWSVTKTKVPTVINQFNTAKLNGVTTNKVRLQMRNSTESTGIVEFQVFGRTQSGVIDFEAPSEPGKPEIVSIDNASITLKFDKSVDNDQIKEYDIVLNDEMLATFTDTIGTINDVPTDKLSYLTVKAKDATGNSSNSEGIWVFVGSQNNQLTSFDWPSYNPTVNYDFRDEYPDITEPTKELDDCPEVVGSQSSGWWTFKWGPKKKSEITEAAITPLLERMNEDFAYFRDVMGWPPDKRAKNGYRSAVYLYGSGLSTDDADSTDLGGWQSSIYYNGESWPMVLASYYPIYSFDPDCPYADREAQMGAMVHEGIHSVLADMPGCKQAAWFHEGGNTWLQQEMESQKSGDYSSMGFLNVTGFIAPFMPIECYTGWLQDDSFGGPSAEGVNMFDGSQQICTWRNLLGGNQYNNTFPTFMGQTLGNKSVAWVWRYCTGRVLEGLADGIGEMQIRKLIIEYRAKQALLDMGPWTGAYKSLLNGSFMTSIGAEWQPSWLNPDEWIATPYAKTTYDASTKTLTPEYRTTPGWSGGNQIPLNVSGVNTGDTIIVDFTPLGKNMSCQLCYRAEDGSTMYGKPVSEGECALVIEKLPANSVVFAVVANSDYIYLGEETRTAHYDYRLKLVKGIYQKASIYKRWYDYEAVIEDVVDNTTTDIEAIEVSDDFTFPVLLNNHGYDAKVTGLLDENNMIEVYDISGNKIYSEEFYGRQVDIQLSKLPAKGIYVLIAKTGGKLYSFKLLNR